jgi:PAS domain S-box-containing protein
MHSRHEVNAISGTRRSMPRNSFRKWLDAYPQPVVVVGRQDRVLSANLAAAELLGCPQSAISRKSLRQITLDSDEELRRLLTAWKASPASVPGHLVFSVDGSKPIPCEVEGALLPLPANRSPSHVVLRLVPKQKRNSFASQLPGPGQAPETEQSALQSGDASHGSARISPAAAAMPAILSGIGEGVVGTNAHGEVSLMNRAAEELTGWKESEALGLPLHVVFRDEIVRDIFRNSETSPTADSSERALLISRHGNETLISKRTVLIRDDAGEISGSVMIFGDITAELEAVQRQEHIREELSHANECLKQYSFSASHDLQEPLRTIAIYSQLLSRKLGPGADDEGAQYLSYLVQGARRMEAFVRDLLAFTEAGTAEVTTALEPVECQSALDAALASLQPAIEDSGAQIVSGNLPVVRAHPVHLVQLFQNLISNAIRYCGEQPPWIEIRANLHHREWEFSISDNGIGIPERYHSHVFGIFKRLAAPGPSARTGIGLAICKRIVERYRGRIWVESKESHGSVFYFTIPVGDPPESMEGKLV